MDLGFQPLLAQGHLVFRSTVCIFWQNSRTARTSRHFVEAVWVFSFLRPSKPAETVPQERPAALCLGIDLGLELTRAVLVDDDGELLEGRDAASFQSPEDLKSSLDVLLRGWPLRDCATTVSLTRDYRLSTMDLAEADQAAIVARADEMKLPFGVDEARFAWQSVGAQRTVVVAYPEELLQLLGEVFLERNFHSLNFEAIEFAQARMLQKRGANVGLLSIEPEIMQFTVATSEDFFSLSQNTALTGLEHFLDFSLGLWKQRGHKSPEVLLTNGSIDFVTRASRIDAESFSEESLAVHLAMSKKGTQRFSLEGPKG